MSESLTKRKKEPVTWIYKDGKKQRFTYPEPKRLSKLGKWRRDNPNGVGLVILDMEAVFG